MYRNCLYFISKHFFFDYFPTKKVLNQIQQNSYLLKEEQEKIHLDLEDINVIKTERWIQLEI